MHAVCVCVCVCIYIYIYIYIYIHNDCTWVDGCMYVYVCVCVYIYIYIYIDGCLCAFTSPAVPRVSCSSYLDGL